MPNVLTVKTKRKGIRWGHKVSTILFPTLFTLTNYIPVRAWIMMTCLKICIFTLEIINIELRKV